MGALSFLKDSIFAEEFSSKIGVLQSLDPRVKTITILLFIILAIMVKSVIVLIFLYLLCLFLVFISKINLMSFLKRTWIFVPIFSLFIAIPAVFNIFTPGIAIAAFNIAGINFVITQQGLIGAALFVMRVITTVSFAVLLSITTKHFELLRVLRIFRIPQIFVMTVGMCYRYIYLFIEIIENTYLAIKSRVGGSIHYKRGQHLVAWNIADLWMRSIELNENVYMAMISRGYRGEAVILERFKFKTRDFVWAAAATAIFVLVIYLNYRAGV